MARVGPSRTQSLIVVPRAELTKPKVVTLEKVREKRKITTADRYKPLLTGIVALLEESRRAAGRA